MRSLAAPVAYVLSSRGRELDDVQKDPEARSTSGNRQKFWRQHQERPFHWATVCGSCMTSCFDVVYRFAWRVVLQNSLSIELFSDPRVTPELCMRSCSIPMGKRYSQIQLSSLSLGLLQCMSTTRASAINVLWASHAMTSMMRLQCECKTLPLIYFQWMLRTKYMPLQRTKIEGIFGSPTQMEVVLRRRHSSTWFNNYNLMSQWDAGCTLKISLALLIGCLLWHCLDF